MTAAEAPGPAPKRSRRGLYIPLILLAIVCLGWTGFWFFARAKTIEVMDAWMAREAERGRAWTCPGRNVSGWPFRLQVSCAAPTFASAEPGRAGQGSLGGIAVHARIADPKNLIAVFSSPLKWRAAAGDELELTFDEARASYRGAPGSLDQASIEFVNAVALWRAPGLEPQSLKATRIEAHLRRAPCAEPGTDFALTAPSLESPALNGLAGEAAPGAIDIRASMTKLAPVPPRDWRATLEEWRIAGGELRIERLNVSKGPLVLTSTGSLRLDDFRRPAGVIDGQAAGLTQILARFGVSVGGGGGAGGLLGAILGGGQRPNQQPRQLPVKVVFDNGRVYFGPFPGPRLAPLY